MRLKKSGPLHLLLRRSDDANSNQFWSVFVYSNFSDLTSNWRPGDRTSPIFPSSSASVPDIGAGRIRWLLLLGPLYPGSLDPSMYGHTYLTMGMFNTLLYCRTKKQFDSAKRLIKPLGVPWETWKLRGHKLIEIETSSKGRRTDGHKKLTRRIVTNKHLRAAESQYRLLIAETLSKALEYCPHHISDWSFFDQSLRATVKENKLDIATRQGMLAITNAILTRHLQQAYSGTTPVTLTQGHLTTKTLLGIG